jgi:hypothetical protein
MRAKGTLDVCRGLRADVTVTDMTTAAALPLPDPEPRPRPRLVDPVPLRDAMAEYVAELVELAPPLSADLRAQLAGLLNE